MCFEFFRLSNGFLFRRGFARTVRAVPFAARDFQHRWNVAILMVRAWTELAKDELAHGRRAVPSANDAFPLAGRFVQALVAEPSGEKCH